MHLSKTEKRYAKWTLYELGIITALNTKPISSPARDIPTEQSAQKPEPFVENVFWQHNKFFQAISTKGWTSVIVWRLRGTEGVIALQIASRYDDVMRGGQPAILGRRVNEDVAATLDFEGEEVVSMTLIVKYRYLGKSLFTSWGYTGVYFETSTGRTFGYNNDSEKTHENGYKHMTFDLTTAVGVYLGLF